CCRGIGFLWNEFCRPVPSCSRLCRPHPQGREAGRPARPSPDQIRAGSQHEDRQGAGDRCATAAPRPRRRGHRMKRREVLTLIGGAAAAWPLAARAQQSAMPVIGFLNPTTPEALSEPMRGLRQGLKDAGFVESENLTIEYRWADNQAERLPAMAAELV